MKDDQQPLCPDSRFWPLEQQLDIGLHAFDIHALTWKALLPILVFFYFTIVDQ